MAPTAGSELSVQITSIPSTVRPNADITVKGSTQKTGGTITAVDVQFGTGAAFKRASNPQGDWSTWSIKGALPSSGQATVTARAQMGVNSSVASRNVLVDGTLPTVDIAAPAPGTIVKGRGPTYAVVVAGTASDAHSGVKSVAVQLESGPGFRVSGTTAWQAVVVLPGAGVKTIVVTATDNAGNERKRQLQVTAVDSVAPELAVTDPKPLPPKVTQPAIKVTGSAFDGTGVHSVTWQLDRGGITPATPLASDWSAWEVAVPIPQPGIHTLRFIAQDSSTPPNVSTALDWQFEIPALSQLRGTDLNAYLHALLEYVTVRVVDKQGVSVTEAMLEQAFFQPFKRLADGAAVEAGIRPTRQVRVCVEALRRLFDGKPASDEVRYREAAYSAILRALGSAYEEVRLARGADEGTRRAIAARLGIVLTLPRPNDELDQLFLSPERLAQGDSEADLGFLFGLADTRVDPLLQGPQPKLQTWKKQSLRSQWAAQDALSAAGDITIPIVDPDVIGPADLRGATGDPVLALWQQRTDWVRSALAALRALRDKAQGPKEAFDQVVAAVLRGLDLESLARAYEDGTDIVDTLDDHELSLAAFLHLLRVRRLAATNAVLETEWEDAFSILVQVRKRRDEYATWRQQEQLQGLTLGPDFFRLRSDENEASPQPIVLPRWRASALARRQWERTLRARIDQDRAARESLDTAIVAAEQEALPILRDLLIRKIDPQGGVDVADSLTSRLQIDTRRSGTQQTTRLHQAVEALHGVLFSLRTNRFGALKPLFDPLPPADWRLTSEEVFDEEWHWMGTYETWRAAILVFAYPENQLVPSLRRKDKQEPAFRNLVEQLRRKGRLTPKEARDVAASYMLYSATPSGPRAESPVGRLEGLLAGDPNLSAATFAPTDRRTQRELAALRTANAALFAKFPDPAHPPEFVAEICYFVPLLLAQQLQKSGYYLAALDWYESVFAYNLPFEQRKIYFGLTAEERVQEVLVPSSQWLLGDGLNPHEIVTRLAPRAQAYTQFTVMSLVRCFLEFGDAEFTAATSESVARARSLYLTALDILEDRERRSAPPGGRVFPPNPMPVSLRLHAETNLAKLRNGQNIAGLELPSTLQPGAARLPTPYRFTALIGRAKELTGIAQQMESAFLAALEKRDAEAYSLLQAYQHIQLAAATVTLQNRRFNEAVHGKALAAAQRDRAIVLAEHFDTLLNEGLSKAEERLLHSLGTMGSWIPPLQHLLGDAGTLLRTIGPAIPFIGAVFSSSESAFHQYLQLSSSFERREEEWRLQRDLAEQEVQIGTQQIIAAHHHMRVVKQEQVIADTQLEHSRATAEFLATKFTNFDLYDFMAGVLGGVYAYFLQQASATAALAESQLAFERQQPSAGFIQADYWQAPPDGDRPSADRQGLTGSARLLQDIFRVDQHAFETRRRHLQLSQTFSMASLAPFDLQQFRETGVLSFATPMELFDRGFPGHYLRLIKRVRVSIIALIPPAHGVRATLTASGLSRVVAAGGLLGDAFLTVVIRRSAEQIAFTGSINATGVLDLEPEGDLLLPFEGMGVDTSWELTVPRAANRFDPATIADVLITIEYSALHSATYREQVIRELNPLTAADRAFSLRTDFADAFYELHNADEERPIAALFETRPTDFPPNLDSLSINEVLLCFVLRDESVEEEDTPASRQVRVAHLLLTPDRLRPTDAEAAVGGPATSTEDGIISTRRGNGQAWSDMRGKPPFGRWELELADDMRPRLDRGEVDDILLVITYSGRTPAWPS